ncbi:pyridoxal-phosphate dependent enzyme [bacterium]|nr:pyridoxal-phosphate dependent enzyme [bacterium]
MNSKLHMETPVISSPKLGKSHGKEVFLKMECYQPVGSFKIRGMGLLSKRMVEEGVSHLFSSSGGNAGYAIAYAGRRLGIQVTVVVPEPTNADVCETIESEGARIERFGRDWNDAHERAMELAERTSGGYLHPFDDPIAWEGHATIVDEWVSQCERPDAIVVSVGGGGLFCGVMQGLQRYPQWKDVPVITAETEGADSLYSSVKSGKLICLDKITSLAATLGVKQVALQAFEWGQTEQVTPVKVSDQQAVHACRRFAQDHRVFVEPACGAALAVVYDHLRVIEQARSILVVVCGGIGAGPDQLDKWETVAQSS